MGWSPALMSLNLDNQFVRLSIEKSLRDLPALPVIVGRILAETANPECSAHSIERLISSDQALASKVLRVVNSAYYGLSGQITSLNQAVMILGIPQVRNLALSVSAISMMKSKTPRQHETLKLFWLHAFGAAAVTQLIAQRRKMRVDDVEALLLGGLMHDIGRLFLYSMFSQTYDQVLKYAEDRQIPVKEAEERLLGLNHSQIGACMAEAWNLPPFIGTLIEQHEGPFAESDLPTFFAVHIADRLTERLYYTSENIVVAPIDPIAEAWLGFSGEETENLIVQAACKITEASTLFGLLAA